MSTQAAEHHKRLWGRPVGEDALRLAGARQKTDLRARSISVASSSSGRLLPGRRPESGEHTYEPPRPTASSRHIYEELNVRTSTPSADPQHGVSSSDFAINNPNYESGPQEAEVEEPHYEFGPQEATDEEPYGGSMIGETGGEEPHYEFAPRDSADEEHIYDVLRKSDDYETPAPSGLGSLNRLGVYLVNGLQNESIPYELKDDLQTAVVYAKQLDQDIVRAATLLDKLNEPGGKLTESERQEVQSLVASNKHNLGVVQAWLAGRQEELAQAGNLTPETRSLFRALQTRIADRHMDLADLTCLYDLDEASPDEPVSREDRCNAHLLDAEAAVAVARNLQGVDPAVKDRLVVDLEQHRDLLANLKDAAGGRLEVPGDGRLALAGKELWETPVPLHKSGAGGDRDISALRAQWRNAGPGRASPLPVAHPKVGQARMLQEFVRFRLGEAGVPKDRTPDLKRQFHEARNQVINRQPWGEVTNRIRTSMPG
ncbi:MAG: hypothetical protein OXU72_04615, partial [Gammaproteobacteria bacterium]|nr:hypothetical protein [Gammaproteobacteria bacterium]